jgi:hypothetical protein
MEKKKERILLLTKIIHGGQIVHKIVQSEKNGNFGMRFCNPVETNLLKFNLAPC